MTYNYFLICSQQIEEDSLCRSLLHHSRLSKRKLKRSHDKGSPCLKARMVSKGSERSLSTLTELRELLNVILQSLISFAGIPNLEYNICTNWSKNTCFSSKCWIYKDMDKKQFVTIISKDMDKIILKKRWYFRRYGG